jgi:hypothetical protein
MFTGFRKSIVVAAVLVVGVAGVGAAHAEGLAEGRFTTMSGKDASPAQKRGAGLQYKLAKQVALRPEDEQYRFMDAFDTKPKLGKYSFGVNVGI